MQGWLEQGRAEKSKVGSNHGPSICYIKKEIPNKYLLLAIIHKLNKTKSQIYIIKP